MYRIHNYVSKFLFILISVSALLLYQQAIADTYRFEGVERVVAVSDVHGAHDAFIKILKETNLVDEELSWAGEETHLVVIGDLLHRGEHGRQAMDLVKRLESEAADAGGAVHFLLGNHEMMAMTGDFRYVSDEAYAQFGSESVDDLPAGFVDRRKAFAPDGTYGRWLLEKPVIIAVNDFVFVHAGLSEMLDGMSMEEINESALRDLRRFAEGWQILLDADIVAEGDDIEVIIERASKLTRSRGRVRSASVGIIEAVKGLAIQPDGPLWYRGSALCHPFAEQHILEDVLEQLGGEHVVVGHTPTLNRRITRRMDERVYRIDTGMNHDAYQGRPSALVIEENEARAVYPTEGAEPVKAELNREWPRPNAMSDEEIEEFLRTAEITETEKVGTGVTQAERLTLEQDGRSMRAIFKTINTDPGLEKRTGRWDREADFADRYMYEMAAYRLDRLLGLHMVPVTVEREIDGQKGAVQYWIEDSINETKRREDEVAYSGHCPRQPQYDIMNAFDVLIFNVDRNLGDILYDRDWRLWLVDHSRAFGTQRGVPDAIREEIRVYPELANALKRVTMENLEDLEPFLHRRQLQALVNRAEWLRNR